MYTCEYSPQVQDKKNVKHFTGRQLFYILLNKTVVSLHKLWPSVAGWRHSSACARKACLPPPYIVCIDFNGGDLHKPHILL